MLMCGWVIIRVHLLCDSMASLGQGVLTAFDVYLSNVSIVPTVHIPRSMPAVFDTKVPFNATKGPKSDMFGDAW